LKKGTLIECIKDVVMVDGEQCFTEAKVYKTYPYTYQEGWDTFKKVTCAKNDQNERHIIIDENEEFFNTHFKVIEKATAQFE